MRIAAALILATALTAGEAAPPAPVELAAQPSNVSRNTNLWFDEGKLQGGQDSLQIGLTAKLSERVRVIEVLGVDLVEALGDDGKPLRLQDEVGSNGGGGDIGAINLTVTFQPPGAQVHTLKSLVVTARCRVAAEGLRRTALRPAREWIAKRMRVDGISGAEIELENLGVDSLTLGMTPALERAIETLTFKNLAGDEIENQGWNDSQEPGWIARVIDVSLPADGSIILDLRQELGERRFTLRAINIPIALPDRAKEPVGVLKTEEVPDGEPGVEAAVPLPVVPKPGF